MFQNTFLLVSLAALVSPLQFAAVKRDSSQLKRNYDFIVAGGGTTGLTVADRLSEAFPKKAILIIEYGEVEYAPGVFDPPLVVWGGVGAKASTWTFQSLPNPEVNNKTALVLAGKVVGGGSAVNGMVFDRGSRFDYDAWAQAGSPEFDSSEHKWNWDGMFSYFKKSVTFTEPSEESVKKYNYTWDTKAWGGSTPIYATYPPFIWADNVIARNAWKDMGVWVPKECSGGDKEGICWVPTSEHPVTARRSHSGLGHYAAVNAARPNYDLLVKHQVIRVVYPKGPSSGPPLVEIRSLESNSTFNMTAKAEVIIAAGALHTPTILQRSGIGPASFLKTAGISVVIDLPGVGSNFQDHSGPSLSWNYTKPGNFSSLPSDMLNPAFAADATAGFNETPARGPYTLALSNSALYLSLPNITIDYSQIIDRIRTIASDGTASSYLPPAYNSDPTLTAGYNHQLAVLADLLSNPKAPSLEVPFATGTSIRSFLLHPLSRGTVRLDLANPLLQPILDYRSASNPIDFDIHLAHLKYLRRMTETETLRSYGAVETAPGEAVQTDDALISYVKDSVILSFMHPCCTAAMLPRNKGGVVGADLRVHGAKGLRVADISVMPFLISAHTSSTAYAIGEKAADIIIKRWKGER